MSRATLRRRLMAKPVIVTPPPHPAPHQYELNTVVFGPEQFRLEGDLDPALVRELLAAWATLFKPPSGVLTPEQVATILTRAESLAKRLEGVDASTS